jgi:hypothetical protein
MDLTDFCYNNYLQYSHNTIDRYRKKFNVIIGCQLRCHWYWTFFVLKNPIFSSWESSTTIECKGCNINRLINSTSLTFWNLI